MAAGKLAGTCAELIAAGRPSTEPAAIVQWAATPEQRTIVGTLDDLPTLAAAARIGPPATLIVGDVVTLAKDVSQTTDRVVAGSPTGQARPELR
jgi:siroheme synthase